MAEVMEFEQVEAVQPSGMPNWLPELLGKVLPAYVGGLHVTEWNEGNYDRQKLEEFHEKLYRSSVEYVLNTYDMEDFYRFRQSEDILRESKRLCELLCSLEADAEPIKLIAEGKLNLDSFSLLREVDIASSIEWFLKTPKKDPEFFGLCLVVSFGGKWKRCPPPQQCFVGKAKTLMKEYLPLKDSVKLDLLIESVAGKCSCISDMLYAEAFSKSGILAFVDQHYNDENVVYNAALDLLIEFDALADDKLSLLKISSSFVTFPLQKGPYGPFAEDVCELVKIAEARRRFECHRFISKWHILWAIGLTEIGASVDKVVNHSGLKFLPKEPANYPQYGIYKAARDVADVLCHPAVEIEDLVLAIVFQGSEGSLSTKTLDGAQPSQKKLKTDDGAQPGVRTEWKNVIEEDIVQSFLFSVAKHKQNPDWRSIKVESHLSQPPPKIADKFKGIVDSVKQFEHAVATGECQSSAHWRYAG